MITIAKLRRKPRHFRAFTGLCVSEFDTLLAHVTPAYEAAELTRRQRPDRQGAINSGHPFRLALSERLLMGLMYLRLYVGQSLLGYLFDLDESNVSRELHGRLLPILLEVLPVPLRDAPLRPLASDSKPVKASGKDKPAPQRRRTNRARASTRSKTCLPPTPKSKKSWWMLPSSRFRNPRTNSNANWPTVARSKTTPSRRRSWLPSPTSCMCSVACPAVSATSRCCASGVLRQLPKKIKVRLDKGYEGTDAAHPDVAAQQPIKKKRGQVQNVLERAYNYMLSTQRIYVEHHFARLQKYQCLAQIWRGKADAHENVFCVVAGLLNFRQSDHMELTA